jgi:hypothetical protein
LEVPDHVLEQSKFVQDWINDNIKYAKLQFPQASEQKLRSILMGIVKKHIQNHNAQIHNDYQDDMRIHADLLKIYDWYHKAKPIAGGNGTFFYNQDIKSSPIQEVIDERIASRKSYQRQRDKYIEDILCYMYRYLDMMQMEAKVTINAIYGSFGATTFQLYNIYTAASTTGTAQSLISTTAMAFESFLNNAVKFKSLGECITMIGNVVDNDPHELPLDGLKIIKSPDIIFEKFKGQFLKWNPEYEEPLRRILHNRSIEELTRLYYNNDLFAFIENDFIKNKIKYIYDVTTSFRNPNEVPENIQDTLSFLWDYCREFVFYNHAYTEQIDRLKHDKRSRVILIDTDSNVVNIQSWVDWTKENIWNISSSKMKEEDMQFCSVNIIAYLVTRMARELLDRYAKDCHVLERYHKRLNTKNEFYFPKILLANVKKRYIAWIRLKEGKQVNKIELKGHDFKKAGINAVVEEEMMKIIRSNIINPPIVNTVGVMKDTAALETRIRESLKNRERTYLNRMNCKVAKAYANPWSQGAYIGPILWNLIYPDNEILIPDKLDIVYISILKESDLEKLKDFPREQELIRKHIFHGGIPELESKGIKYLALPNDGSKIPEWVYPVMDIERIVTRNTGTFYPVLTALNFTTITSGDNEYFSNILRI